MHVHWINVLSDFNSLNEWAQLFAIAIGFVFDSSCQLVSPTVRNGRDGLRGRRESFANGEVGAESLECCGGELGEAPSLLTV